MRALARPVSLLALAALLSACATTGGIAPWPPRQTAAAAAPPAGVLFKLNVDADMQGMYLNYVQVFFHPLAPDRNSIDTQGDQQLIVAGDAINKFPNDVVLLPLKPGEYFGTAVGLVYSGSQSQGIVTQAIGAFEHFTLKPGQIRVLGSLDVVAKDRVVSQDANGQQQRTTTNTTSTDSSLAKKLEILDAALSRSEADRLGWRGALEDARRDVLAAGEFGDEYMLKSWPTRAPAEGAAAHPATAALFRLRVENPDGFPIMRLKVHFQPAGPPSKDALWPYVVIPGDQLNRFPNDPVLVSPPPGAYAGALVEFVTGIDPKTSLEQSMYQSLYGEFQRFDIEPGKVTVLPVVDLNLSKKSTALPDGQVSNRWNLDIGILDKDKGQTPEAKRLAAESRWETVASALARPEAESLRWKEALELAKASLAP